MSNKISKWELWDWKSIRASIYFMLVFTIILFMFSYAPDIVTEYRKPQFDKKVIGKVVSINEQSQSSQGRYGNRHQVYGVIVTYLYYIKEKPYFGVYSLPYDANKMAFIRQLHIEDSVTVMYSSTEVSKSRIELK